MALDERAAGEAARRRRWKRIRTSVTLLILVGVVVGAAWYSWRSVTEDEEPQAASTTQACVPNAPTAAPAPGDIQLNVYNSTDRRGLASSVAKELRSRGFSVLEIANDPLDKLIEGSAEIRSNSSQQAAASLIAALVPGASFLPDERTEPVVDLVLGNAFEALAAADAPVGPPPTGLPVCEPPT